MTASLSDTQNNNKQLAPAAPQEGPRRTIEQNGVRYTLLGTAHVSKASADEVATLIQSGEFDAVAIELCAARYKNMLEPDNLANMDILRVIREGKAGMVAANLVMGAFQQRVAEESGIAPGEEMKAAIREAQAADLPIMVIDRDIGVTLKRVYRNVPWWQRSSLLMGIFGSLITREKVSPEEIERLKQGDVLQATFNSFAEESEELYKPLVDERDEYMALRLEQESTQTQPPYQHVLVVIGAGHLAGMSNYLQADPPEHPAARLERLHTLETVPEGAKWFKYIPWVVAGLIIIGFAIGFSRSPEFGFKLVTEWFLINGTLTALGVIIARGHPVTVLAGFLAAPFTSLNPTIGAGFVAAGVELFMRKPTVGDFAQLREDVTEVKGWWRNRVSRTLLVFFLATLGSAIATYVGGFRIFGQLAGG